MRRLGALLLLGLGALLLTPGAPGVPDTPGDPTPPVVTPVITGTLGSEGWYTSNVTVNWTVTDPESIILSTSGCDARTLNADSTGTRLTCTAESDGGETIVSKTFKLDKTAPAPTATPSRPADSNGWYNHALSVDYAGADTMSGVATCSAPNSYGGPDTGSASLGGTCTDHAGNTAGATFPFKYDETAPQASPSARVPDANGWYNHAVTVTFQGADSTSGVSSCTQTTYSGPDDPSASLSGTCLDRAGNASGSSQLTLRYDETAPQATATPSRSTDVNGWYRAPLTVSFSGSDTTSGLDSCDAPKTYSGPDSTSTSVAGACRDNAGNSAPRSVGLKYDATAPGVTATPSRQPNAAGWYNAPLTVGFSGTDPISGNASCVADKTYGGPDAGAASVSGTCTDNAGNVGSAALPLKYDATAPQATATPSRQPNANGWYRASLNVSFAGTDATSGVESCDAAKTYAGPDAAAASLSGSCRDRAGNPSAPGAFGFKYDATAPQATATAARQPNAAGWYTAPVAVNFAGTDALSGVESCDAQKTYAGPDAAATSVAGSCVDDAGNTGSASVPLKYDATAPQTTATPSRQPNGNGWYSAPLTVSFAASDGTSGVDTCDAAKSYGGPDNGSASVAGACRDKAGNSAGASLPLKYDATAPAATATASRQPNAAGWYNAPLSVSFAATDGTSGLDSCPAAKSYSGPDDGAATVNGTCFDKAGNGGLASLPVRYDATAPQATATPSRQPNANNWYNAPLSISFAAADATSGLESCPAAKSYSGPDDGAAAVTGTCFDKAGNGGVTSLPLRYDATAPAASATAGRQPNAAGWFNAAVSVSFAGSDVLSGLDSCPAPKSYSGPDTASAVVSGTCLDKAGNGTLASLPLKYDATAPQTTATPSRQPNANGWYNAPLSVAYSGTDAVAGIQQCDAQESYGGPDDAAAALSGVCTDRAGNAGSASFPVRYDATAPQTTATPARQPNGNGWYNAPVSVSFGATDVTSTVDSCDAAKSYGGPDSGSAALAGACRDKAGNSAIASLPLRYDATAPQTTATPARQPNANGWFNAPLTVSFAGTDSTAGIESCDGNHSYGGPDAANATVSGSCRDRAGNSDADSYALKFDATAPAAAATPSRAADSNGWYNHALTVTFAGSDGLSGLASCPAPAAYAGPDNSTAAVSGTCFDKAGNGGLASLPVRYDATAPQATATPSRQPNANGWYNAAFSVSFAATDATSGLDSCPAAKSYAGPDSGTASVSGTCLDKAGNGTLASLPLKYDATAPQTTATASRQPNGNGWYNAPLEVAFAGADATSGTASCSAPASYAGPDTGAANRSGSCIDRAGNSSASSLAFKYDETPPDVARAVPLREPDRAGWYNRPVVVDAEGSDATSGIASCPPATYTGPDGDDAPISGTCVDLAGNVGLKTFTIDYDATAPHSTAAPSRGPDANGWYKGPLTVGFAGSDPVSGLESCAGPERYDGPDSGAAVVSGICLDKAGNAGVASFDLHFDATPPQLTGVNPDRAPDAAGWYNHPLGLGFQGADATSGIDHCTRATYGGPDAASASVQGLCRDRAGNDSGVGSFALRYDATAPAVTRLVVKPGNRDALVSWTASSDTSLVELKRGERVVYRGAGTSFRDRGLENGRRYRYSLTAFDEAANRATAGAAATPTAPLSSPAAGAKVSAPPLLAWTPVPKATYYNVQIWRKGRILSLWPRRTSIRLKRSWSYEGRRYRLTPGRYRWFVWPGYGKRAAKDFGRMLGSSSFVVVR